jgi:uncharacterized protein (TIGR04255 family)
MPSLEFGQLPLVEVTIRLSAVRPLPFSVTSAVNLHSALKSRLPVIDDLVELEPAPGRMPIIEFGPGRILGARYRDPARGIYVGVQHSVVFARWIRDDDKPYPRFSTLNNVLWFAVEQLQKEFGDVRFDVANMSYTNFVPKNAASVQEFLDRYFVEAVRPKVMKDADQFHDLNMSWRSTDAVDLRLGIERGEAALSSPIKRSEGYKIVTVAGTRFAEGASPEAVVAQLHDKLQVLFESILSPDAKKEWGYAQPQ